MRGQVRQFSISEAILKNSFTSYSGRKIILSFFTSYILIAVVWK